MSNQYDAQYKEGMLYVVECENKHSSPCKFYEAVRYQINREKEGRTAIIRTWG
jgi:hypothetical protein